MNIFILDNNIEKCVQYYVDKHVVKMPLEYAQILCTVHHIYVSEFLLNVPYKPTHINHKCVKWVKSSLQNYIWLCQLGLALCKEYTYRYGRIHKCEEVIRWCLNYQPNIPEIGLTTFVQAMPDEFKDKDPIIGYRNYYNGAKTKLFNWKNRSVPPWIKI